jgi:putative membrane protein
MNPHRRRWFTAICLLFVAAPVHAHQTESIAQWNFEPWVVASLVLAAWGYVRGLRRLWTQTAIGRGIRRWQAAAYAAGWMLLVVALVTPLDSLGSQSFAAHMLQHEVLMLLAAPLLVLGRPLGPYLWAMPIAWRRVLGEVAKTRWFSTSWRTLTHPLTAWALHAAVLWIWHAPVLFEAALRSDALHALQHLSFLLSALLFWWALFNSRDAQGAAVLYLFTTGLHTSVLGALLTFARSIWYPVYDQPPLGLNPLEDQQLGGLIMWVPGGMVYVLAALALFGAWLARSSTSRAWR